MTPEGIALYRRAILVWGEEAQMRMAQEECAELIVAISHVLRSPYPLRAELIEELADVQIMVEQLVLLLGPALVARARAEKLDRLTSRVEAAEAERAESERAEAGRLPADPPTSPAPLDPPPPGTFEQRLSALPYGSKVMLARRWALRAKQVHAAAALERAGLSGLAEVMRKPPTAYDLSQEIAAAQEAQGTAVVHAVCPTAVEAISAAAAALTTCRVLEAPDRDPDMDFTLLSWLAWDVAKAASCVGIGVGRQERAQQAAEVEGLGIAVREMEVGEP